MSTSPKKPTTNSTDSDLALVRKQSSASFGKMDGALREAQRVLADALQEEKRNIYGDFNKAIDEMKVKEVELEAKQKELSFQRIAFLANERLAVFSAEQMKRSELLQEEQAEFFAASSAFLLFFHRATAVLYTRTQRHALSLQHEERGLRLFKNVMQREHQKAATSLTDEEEPIRGGVQENNPKGNLLQPQKPPGSTSSCPVSVLSENRKYYYSRPSSGCSVPMYKQHASPDQSTKNNKTVDHDPTSTSKNVDQNDSSELTPMRPSTSTIPLFIDHYEFASSSSFCNIGITELKVMDGRAMHVKPHGQKGHVLLRQKIAPDGITRFKFSQLCPVLERETAAAVVVEQSDGDENEKGEENVTTSAVPTSADKEHPTDPSSGVTPRMNSTKTSPKSSPVAAIQDDKTNALIAKELIGSNISDRHLVILHYGVPIISQHKSHHHNNNCRNEEEEKGGTEESNKDENVTTSTTASLVSIQDSVARVVIPSISADYWLEVDYPNKIMRLLDERGKRVLARDGVWSSKGQTAEPQELYLGVALTVQGSTIEL